MSADSRRYSLSLLQGSRGWKQVWWWQAQEEYQCFSDPESLAKAGGWSYDRRIIRVGETGACMPKVDVNGIGASTDEEHGSGPPLVMIGGLGADTYLWSKQVPVFSERFRVVVFDNRGSGESDKPDEPYSIPMFVADTVGLMRVLEIERAHVVGASLGGLGCPGVGAIPC